MYIANYHLALNKQANQNYTVFREQVMNHPTHQWIITLMKIVYSVEFIIAIVQSDTKISPRARRRIRKTTRTVDLFQLLILFQFFKR